MEVFINYLQKHISLSDSEIEAIKENVYLEHVPAKSFILQAGETCKRLGFITSGVIRMFFYDTEGNEIVRCFHNENHFFGDLSSYQNNTISDQYIQAVTDCSIVFFNRENDHHLYKTLEKWPLLIRKFTEKAFVQKIDRSTNLIHADAKTKYLHFLSKHADVAQRVPLGDIASYLGIAQQSLSRIRKNMTL